ncbi:nuclear transport factor 2 family protein [Streptomyces sp. NPDC056309]|uniref:nuclear transport factor 2 family protein n=1 Tax=unclassified Streptomyces TaxID=2593676 RepID=UPI0035E276A6
MSMTVGDSAPFGANSPFFRVIEEGLEGLVDGEDYFGRPGMRSARHIGPNRPAYDNRFVSVVTIKDGKVTHWRDCLDPVAVFDASGWPQGRGWLPQCSYGPAVGRAVGGQGSSRYSVMK